MKRPQTPLPRWLAFAMIAQGGYVLAGFACLLLARDWPPFWPPLDDITALIPNAVLSFIPLAVLVFVGIASTVLACSIALTVMGLRRLWPSGKTGKTP